VWALFVIGLVVTSFLTWRGRSLNGALLQGLPFFALSVTLGPGLAMLSRLGREFPDHPLSRANYYRTGTRNGFKDGCVLRAAVWA